MRAGELMAMSDSDYLRVVEELKASKAHLPGRGSEEWQRIGRCNVQSFISSIHSQILRMNGYRQTGGPHDATVARAEALKARCEALTLWQFVRELQEAAHSVAMRIWKQDSSPEACDRGLAEIDVAMSIAEKSPR
jgi:hypothetical protein